MFTWDIRSIYGAVQPGDLVSSTLIGRLMFPYMERYDPVTLFPPR